MILPGCIIVAKTPWSERARPTYVLDVHGVHLHVAHCAEDVFENRRKHQVRVVGCGLTTPTLICLYRTAKIQHDPLMRVIAVLPDKLKEHILRIAQAIEIPLSPGHYAKVHYLPMKERYL